MTPIGSKSLFESVVRLHKDHSFSRQTVYWWLRKSKSKESHRVFFWLGRRGK